MERGRVDVNNNKKCREERQWQCGPNKRRGERSDRPLTRRIGDAQSVAKGELSQVERQRRAEVESAVVVGLNLGRGLLMERGRRGRLVECGGEQQLGRPRTTWDAALLLFGWLTRCRGGGLLGNVFYS